MVVSKSLSALALMAGVLVAGGVQAQGLQPPFTEYAAKFSCGPLKGDGDVAQGIYDTAINIHNPQATVSLAFVKKFVIANEEGADFGKIVVKKDSLRPDIAERVDCVLIEKTLGIAAGAHVEGFIVIEVAAAAGAAAPTSLPIDVVGIYSARGLSGTTSAAVSVVPYSGKLITK